MNISTAVKQDLGNQALSFLMERTHPLSEFTASVLNQSFTDNIENAILFEQVQFLFPELLRKTGDDAFTVFNRAMARYIGCHDYATVKHCYDIMAQSSNILINEGVELPAFTPFAFETKSNSYSSSNEGYSLFYLACGYQDVDMLTWCLSFYEDNDADAVITSLDNLLNQRISSGAAPFELDRNGSFEWLLDYACQHNKLDILIKNNAVAKFMFDRIEHVAVAYDKLINAYDKDTVIAVMQYLEGEGNSLLSTVEEEVYRFMDNVKLCFNRRRDVFRKGGGKGNKTYEVTSSIKYKKKMFAKWRWFKTVGLVHPYLSMVLKNVEVMDNFLIQGLKRISNSGHYSGAYDQGVTKGLSLVISWRNQAAGNLFFGKDTGTELSRLLHANDTKIFEFIAKLYVSSLPVTYWIPMLKTPKQYDFLAQNYSLTPMQMMSSLPDDIKDATKKVILNELSHGM